MDRRVGAVGAPGALVGERPHQRRLDALALGLPERRAGASVAAEGVEGVAEHLRVLPGTQDAEDGQLRQREPLGEALGLAQQKLAGCLLAAAQAAQLPGAAALVDLDRDQHLVLGARRRRRLDQLDVGADEGGVERDGAVALGLQVGGQLVALGGQGALDPLQAPDRAAVAPAARQHRAPGVELSLLLGSVAQAEGPGAHRERGGVGAGAAVAHHPDLLAAVGDREQLEVGERRGQ